MRRGDTVVLRRLLRGAEEALEKSNQVIERAAGDQTASAGTPPAAAALAAGAAPFAQPAGAGAGEPAAGTPPAGDGAAPKLSRPDGAGPLE